MPSVNLMVSVPVCSFRKPYAREFFESERIPPPATVYGFLLSLIGEENRYNYVGSKIAIAMLSNPSCSIVLRTLWRIKENNFWRDPTGKTHLVSPKKKERKPFIEWVKQQGWKEPKFIPGLGLGANRRPDYQELLTGLIVSFWIADSPLADKIRETAAKPGSIERFGGLSLGESRDLVDEVVFAPEIDESSVKWLVNDPKGNYPLTIWVDHVGSKGTKWGQFRLAELPPSEPPRGDARWITIEPPV